MNRQFIIFMLGVTFVTLSEIFSFPQLNTDLLANVAEFSAGTLCASYNDSVACIFEPLAVAADMQEGRLCREEDEKYKCLTRYEDVRTADVMCSDREVLGGGTDGCVDIAARAAAFEYKTSSFVQMTEGGWCTSDTTINCTSPAVLISSEFDHPIVMERSTAGRFLSSNGFVVTTEDVSWDGELVVGTYNSHTDITFTHSIAWENGNSISIVGNQLFLGDWILTRNTKYAINAPLLNPFQINTQLQYGLFCSGYCLDVSVPVVAQNLLVANTTVAPTHYYIPSDKVVTWNTWTISDSGVSVVPPVCANCTATGDTLFQVSDHFRVTPTRIYFSPTLYMFDFFYSIKNYAFDTVVVSVPSTLMTFDVPTLAISSRLQYTITGYITGDCGDTSGTYLLHLYFQLMSTIVDQAYIIVTGNGFACTAKLSIKTKWFDIPANQSFGPFTLKTASYSDITLLEWTTGADFSIEETRILRQ